MMTDLEFGKALRRLRQQSGVKQEEVAMLSGYDQTEISRMERGNRSITVQALRGYAVAINTESILALLELTLKKEKQHHDQLTGPSLRQISYGGSGR